MQLSHWFHLDTMNNFKTISLSLTLALTCNTLANATAGSLTSGVNPPLAARIPAGSASATPDTQPKDVPSYTTYNYYGEKYRDPFVPLIGETRSSQMSDRPPAIASLMLKGIVQDNNGRLALLTSGVNSYILRGGRFYDGRNKMVKGLSGVIKTDSVVVIGSDRTIREIRTKTTL